MSGKSRPCEAVRLAAETGVRLPQARAARVHHPRGIIFRRGGRHHAIEELSQPGRDGADGGAGLRAIRFDGRTLVLQTEAPPTYSAAQQQRWQQLGYVVKTSREGVTMTWEGPP